MEIPILIGLVFMLLYYGDPLWILLCELFSKPGVSDNSPPPKVSEIGKSEMIGCRTTLTSPLKPAGMVRINGVNYDAISEFGLVETGEEVEVVSKKDKQLVVRRCQNHSA